MKTLKLIYIFIFIIELNISNSTAQDMNFCWGDFGGGSSNDAARGVAYDINGNIVIVGTFSDKFYFKDTFLISNGAEDFFIAKLTIDKRLMWIKQIGGLQSDKAYDVDVDGNDNILLTGWFGESIDIDSLILNSFGSLDCFTIKLNKDGKAIWAIGEGGNNIDDGNEIAIDNENSVIVAGNSRGDFKIGGTTYENLGKQSCPIIKYDSSGTLQWVANITTVEGECEGKGIETDGFNNVLITGKFTKTLLIDSLQFASNGAEDVFIAKYNKYGKLLWAKTFGSDKVDEGKGIMGDNNGNAYFTGFFTGTVDLYDTVVSGYSKNIKNAFVLKLDSIGTIKWVKCIGSPNTIQNGLEIECNSNGYSVTAGDFSSEISVGNKSVISNGMSDIFVVSFDTFGNLLWLISDGEKGIEILYDLDFFEDSLITCVGHYNGESHFANDKATVYGNDDLFLTQLSPKCDAIISSSDEYKNNIPLKNELLIYQNPVKEFLFIHNDTPVKVIIFNLFGEIIYENKSIMNEPIPVLNLNDGLYFININDKIYKFLKLR